jgi:hypothetical protein
MHFMRTLLFATKTASLEYRDAGAAEKTTMEAIALLGALQSA